MAVLKKVAIAKNGPAGIVLALALKALKTEPVQARLKDAPDAAVRWAQKRRAQKRFGTVIDVTEAAPARAAAPDAAPTPPRELPAGSARSRTSKLNPTERIGQRGLERRVTQLAAGFETAFSTSATGVPAEVTSALDDLGRALTATAGLPVVKRTKSQYRIAGEIDRLEDALIEAVLPR
jgi:hypothetical protein